MPRVMTTCPVTGETVPVGLEVESREEFEIGGFASMAFHCPACERMHTWTVEEATLEGE
jgi:hypothetical protein